LSLTEWGRDFLPYVAEALSMISAGTQRLPSARADRRILISCAPTFAARWLLPLLPRFRERYPDIALSIDTSHRQLGFPADGVDLAIRMGQGPWPGHSSTRLVGESLVPVCSPAYLRSLPRRDGGVELGKADLIHLSSVGEDWAAWLEAAGIAAPDLAKGLRFDTIELALAAAASGLGVVIGRKPLVDAELARGALVAAAEPVIAAATAYWLIGSPASESRPDIASFRRWLIRETASLR
jgi:DNA-binding transcriptional LysR family regulator